MNVALPMPPRVSDSNHMLLFFSTSPWWFIKKFRGNHSTTQSYLGDSGQGHVGGLDDTKGKAGQSLEEWGRGGDQESLARRSWEGIQRVCLNHWLRQKRMGLTDNSFHILYIKLVDNQGWCQGDIFRQGALPAPPHMMSATNYFASSCG